MAADRIEIRIAPVPSHRTVGHHRWCVQGGGADWHNQAGVPPARSGPFDLPSRADQYAIPDPRKEIRSVSITWLCPYDGDIPIVL